MCLHSTNRYGVRGLSVSVEALLGNRHLDIETQTNYRRSNLSILFAAFVARRRCERVLCYPVAFFTQSGPFCGHGAARSEHAFYVQEHCRFVRSFFSQDENSRYLIEEPLRETWCVLTRRVGDTCVDAWTSRAFRLVVLWSVHRFVCVLTAIRFVLARTSSMEHGGAISPRTCETNTRPTTLTRFPFHHSVQPSRKQFLLQIRQDEVTPSIFG